MPDVYYCCHGCGSIHEVEAIRRNLHLGQHPIGDPWFPPRSVLGWLERRRVTTLLMRGLWPQVPLEAGPPSCPATTGPFQPPGGLIRSARPRGRPRACVPFPRLPPAQTGGSDAAE